MTHHASLPDTLVGAAAVVVIGAGVGVRRAAGIPVIVVRNVVFSAITSIFGAGGRESH